MKKIKNGTEGKVRLQEPLKNKAVDPSSNWEAPHRPESAMSGARQYLAGLTPASLAAGFFSILLMSMLVQYGEVYISMSDMALAEHTLGVPAIWVGMLLLVVVALSYGVARLQILTRAELMCVIFAMLLAAPLMTQGFWHRIVAIISTIPRDGQHFDIIDAYNDALWPHGPNVLKGKLNEANVRPQGNIKWENIEYEKGVKANIPVIVNGTGENNCFRLRVPVVVGNSIDEGVVAGDPHMLTALLRARDLTPESKAYSRLYLAGGKVYTEILLASPVEKRTVVHKTGFQRMGMTSVKLDKAAKDYVEIEFGLTGPGRLEVADPKMLSMSPIESMLDGKILVPESRYQKMLDAGQPVMGLIVKPDNMWSWPGLKFILSGYIPVREWAGPMLAWGTFLGLVFLSFIAINAIMRKQWMDAERYPLPMTRVVQGLLGNDLGAPGAFSSIVKSPMLWGGIAAGLFFDIWHFAATRNPSLTDPAISMNLQDYINWNACGNMFRSVSLNISIFFLALCLFMELNVLLSIVLGFWLYRCQFWAGHSFGWTAQPGFPYASEQTLAAYLGYFVVILALSWRYLAYVAKAAFKNDKAASVGELFSYRTSFLLFLLAVAGMATWGYLIGISIVGILMFYLCILGIGFVAAKLRTECGMPWSYFTPQGLALFLVLCGGLQVLGPGAVLFCVISGYFLASGGLFFIPGTQMEMVELGRRWRVNPSHIAGTIALALAAGLVLGGWTYLSNAYALGANQINYSWGFSMKSWYLLSFKSQVQEATAAFIGTQGTVSAVLDPSWYAYMFSASVAALLAILRQIFAGFWFHPIGFILGTTACVGDIWGSALLAWMIRYFVLWIGGAATVRNKLQPFAIGLFLGGALAEFMIMIYMGANPR